MTLRVILSCDQSGLTLLPPPTPVSGGWRGVNAWHRRHELRALCSADGVNACGALLGRRREFGWKGRFASDRARTMAQHQQHHHMQRSGYLVEVL